MIFVYLYSFLFVTSLAAAFVAQWFLPPSRRTRIIFAAAAAPSTLLIIAALIGALFVRVDVGWFEAVVSLLLWFLTFMFTGLVGAIFGSELASLARWLLRRHG